jgi:uncharacterized protein (DUF2147 family)
MSRWRLILTIFLVIAGGLPARAGPPDITGWWLDGSGRGGILIENCADKLCGAIRWLKEPLDPKTGKPKVDNKSDDPAFKGHPICGLKILWDFTFDEPDRWTHGRIYDPESGNVYKSTLTPKADGTLDVRGYVGISLFGESQIWRRPAAPLPDCTAG